MPRNNSSALYAIPALLASLALTHVASAATHESTATANRVAVLETKQVLRDLWVEHIFWIRSYVVASHAGNAQQRKVAEAEVVTNAKALAQSISPYYGPAASDALFKLLAGHWTAVRDFNEAKLSKSKAAQDRAATALTANARELAKFLSGANPFLPEDAVFGLLSSHGGHHISQIEQIASGAYQNEAATWHAMRKHMFAIADAIADALAKQFADRFQKGT
jgi:hypothetical protein